MHRNRKSHPLGGRHSKFDHFVRSLKEVSNDTLHAALGFVALGVFIIFCIAHCGKNNGPTAYQFRMQKELEDGVSAYQGDVSPADKATIERAARN